MQDQDLIRMANQIADFFEPYPREEAVDGIADHIDSFWEPRMRLQLCDIVDRGGEGLNPLAKAGAEKVREATRAEVDAGAPTENKIGGGAKTHGN